ncbi:MAG TPA: B-4DMT family transporter [Pseudonocardiaceae bacterium]|jgi:hypothetical protein|nr:B-4DMT family transporter [Pseudonocardiaceae bacterium]
MRRWLVRGGGMAVLHALTQTLLAAAEIDHPGAMSLIRPLALAGLVGAACLWSAIDGWRRVPGRGMAWFWAALFGGLLAGLLGVLGQALFVDQSGLSALAPALTGGAAFTALLIMVPAGLGLAVGGRLTAPRARPAPPAQSTQSTQSTQSAPRPFPRPSPRPRS